MMVAQRVVAGIDQESPQIGACFKA
jgi:hypothetical protein